MKTVHSIAAVIVCLLAAGCHPCDGATIDVDDPQGLTKVTVCVEWASTEAELKQGLTGRAALPRGEGLWMDFSTVGEVCITAEGMQFPIDAVYVDAADQVVGKHSFGVNDKALVCKPAIQSVLEVNAGEAESVTAGDKIVVHYRGL